MIAEAALTLVCIAQAATIALVLRSQSAERGRLLRAIVAQTPQEYAMLEKAAAPSRVKASKTPTPIPFGL